MSDIKLTPKDWNIDGAKLGINPGDRIVLLGPTRSNIQFGNLKGTKENPIVITATEKIVINGANRVVIFSNCSFIRFTGSDKKLIEITGGAHGVDFRDLSTNIEVDNLYLHDLSYSGIDCKTDPSCDPKTWRGNFTMRDIFIHDNRIVNTKGEGIYLGESHYHEYVTVTCAGKSVKVQEHDVTGVRIVNNDLKNIGRDAIQVGSATDCVIEGNNIKDFGMTKEGAHASGIQLNPGTNAEVRYNVIDGGKAGFGIFAGGRGASYIHHNLIMNCGNGASPVVGGGLLMAAYAPIDPMGFRVVNNTFLNIHRAGIEAFAETGDNLLGNNIIHTLSGVPIKRNNTKTKLLEVGNLYTKDLVGLKLDASYVPMVGSEAYKETVDIGAYTSVKQVVTKEAGTVEVVVTNGLEEVFIVTPTKRIRIK